MKRILGSMTAVFLGVMIIAPLFAHALTPADVERIDQAQQSCENNGGTWRGIPGGGYECAFIWPGGGGGGIITYDEEGTETGRHEYTW